MRRLAIGNNNMSEIDTFKDIFSDLLICNQDNQVPGHKKYMEPTLSEALIAAKLKNIGKKKAKGQAFTKRLSLERNLRKKIPRGHKTPIPLLIAM